MSKYKLAISIPTYNRADSINNLLDNSADILYKHNVALYILDVSNDNLTETIVKSFKSKGYTNIEYFHYVDTDRTIRFRDMMTLPDAEYLMPCRDRFYINNSKAIELLLSLLTMNPDILTFHSDSNNRVTPVEIFKTQAELFLNNAGVLAILGNFIIRKKLLENLEINFWEKSYLRNWPHLASALHAIATTNNFFGLSLVFSPELYYENNETHVWEQPDEYFNAFVIDNNDYINDLPEIYKEVIQQVENDFSKIAIPRHLTNYLYLRERNILNLKTLKKHYSSIKKVSAISMGTLFCISLLPTFFSTALRSLIKTGQYIIKIVYDFWTKSKYFIIYKIKQ